MRLDHEVENPRGTRDRPVLPERIRRRLEMQGFACAQQPSFEPIVPWLRFSPGLTTVGVAIGTVLASPMILLGLSSITGLCAVSTRHPFDLLYNHGVRRVTGSSRLPRNRMPRRFACGIATVWLTIIAIAFWADAPLLGYPLGTMLVFLGGLVATTHFCFGSYLYQGLCEWIAKRTGPKFEDVR